MNYNLIAYITFLSVVIYIIAVVGKTCYRNGNIYVLELLQGHKDLCLRINQVLLAGYYLLNIGYAATTLINWKYIETIPQLIETVALKSAIIIGVLSVLHYLNIFILTKYAKKLIK